MYLHLGQGIVVPDASVLGIFDMDNTTSSHITRRFLNGNERNGKLVSITDDLPKSFVVCNSDNETTIYLSQLSSATLSKRTYLSFEKEK